MCLVCIHSWEVFLIAHFVTCSCSCKSIFISKDRLKKLSCTTDDDGDDMCWSFTLVDITAQSGMDPRESSAYHASQLCPFPTVFSTYSSSSVWVFCYPSFSCLLSLLGPTSPLPCSSTLVILLWGERAHGGGGVDRGPSGEERSGGGAGAP